MLRGGVDDRAVWQQPSKKRGRAAKGGADPLACDRDCCVCRLYRARSVSVSLSAYMADYRYLEPFSATVHSPLVGSVFSYRTGRSLVENSTNEDLSNRVETLGLADCKAVLYRLSGSILA